MADYDPVDGVGTTVVVDDGPTNWKVDLKDNLAQKSPPTLADRIPLFDQADTGNPKYSTLTQIQTAILAAAAVKTAYELNADTNEFDDTEKGKLGGIAIGATKFARWADVTTFTATPNSTSVLLMADTSKMKVGVPVRYSDSGGPFYAQITAIDPNVSITIRGAPFDTGDDVTALAVGLPEMITWVILDVPGNYADAADTDLNDGTDGKKMFWEGPRAYGVGFDMLHSLADTGAAQPRANLRFGGESTSISSTGSSAGPLLSTAQTVVSTVVDINTANYHIDLGDKITCTCDGLGSNDDAEGLEMHAVFVME